MFYKWVLFVFALFLLAPIGVIGLAENNTQIDPAARADFGGVSANYKLVSISDPNKALPGNMGSYVLPEKYSDKIDHSLEVNVLTQGLATYYPFDTGFGEMTYDNSINHKTGNLINGTSWTGGTLGSALLFDGKDDYVSAGIAEGLRTATQTSWSAWIKPADVDKVSQDQMILSLQGENHLRLFGRKLVGSYKINGQPLSVSGITPLENNKWYHVASSYNGNSLQLFLNGNLEAELTDLKGNVELGAGNFEVGRWQSNDPRFYSGIIDEVKIYNRPLSSREVKLEYNSNLGGVSSAQPLFIIEPGASQISNLTPIILSDVAAYQFSFHEDRPLTQVNGDAYVPSITGTFANPQEWSEGFTKGLGFSWTNSSFSKWGKYPNNRYSAINNQDSVLDSTDYSLPNRRREIDLQYRLDTSDNEPPAVYVNSLIYTGMLKP